MKVIELFIKRPVLTISVCLIILLIGIIAGLHLEIRQSPQMDSSVIQVHTTWSGASAQIISDTITTKIQEALSGIDDIDYQTAKSRMGESEILLYFHAGFSESTALAAINSRITAIKNQLPNGVDAPEVHKLASDNRPAMIIAFTSPTLTRLEVGQYLRRHVKPIFELIDGVSSADVMGESYAMRIWLDPLQLQANHMTANEVALRIQQEHFLASGGTQQNFNSENLLNIHSVLSLPDEFENINLKPSENSFLKLGDLARVNLAPADENITAFLNGTPATMIFVHLMPSANPLVISKQINKVMQQLKPTLPEGLKGQVAFDSSNYIHRALREVNETILFTFLMIAVVMVSSLGSFKLAFVPLITIPLSLAGTCIFLKVLHCSINLFTLLAVVLAIGLVVDDSIIVVENIHRKMLSGVSLKQAAIDGINEIIGPIISMSFILTAAYLPIILTNGLTGRLFAEFALTLSISVILSALIAFILSPLLSMYLLRSYPCCANLCFDWIAQFYARILNVTCSYRNYLLYFLLASLPLSIFLYQLLPSELAPREDQGFLQVIGKASSETNTNYLNVYTKKLDKEYRAIPSIDHYIRVNNIPDPHQFISFVGMQPWSQRHQTIEEIHQELQRQLDLIPEIQSRVVEPASLPSDGGFPIEYVLKSTFAEKSLLHIAREIQNNAMHSGLFRFVDIDTRFDHSDTSIEIDRTAAAWLGINLSDVAKNLASYFL